MKISDSQCTGCLACVDICSQKCISVKTDEEGFIHPEVHLDKCIGCGMCDRVCPVQNIPLSQIKNSSFFAAKHKDTKIQTNSSSGGVFSALAKEILDNDGIVIGGVEQTGS